MATPWRAIGGKFRELLAAAKSSAAAATATSAVPKAAKSAKRSPSAASGAVNRETGIMKAVPISPTLGQFLGSSEASRTEAIKKVWDHIKANGLQNPSNKKEIICDEKLKTLFGKEKVGFLEIARLLSPHFVKSG